MHQVHVNVKIRDIFVRNKMKTNEWLKSESRNCSKNRQSIMQQRDQWGLLVFGANKIETTESITFHLRSKLNLESHLLYFIIVKHCNDIVMHLVAIDD